MIDALIDHLTQEFGQTFSAYKATHSNLIPSEPGDYWIYSAQIDVGSILYKPNKTTIILDLNYFDSQYSDANYHYHFSDRDGKRLQQIDLSHQESLPTLIKIISRKIKRYGQSWQTLKDLTWSDLKFKNGNY